MQDPGRLRALRALDLLDTPPEPMFDRITILATMLLGAPVALVSLVDAGRQFFKSQAGLDEPWASRRETPLSHSFCQHVVATGEPLVVADARRHRVLRHNPAIAEMKVVAYVGVPLRTSGGAVLGTVCAIDRRPRRWTRNDVRLLGELAALAIELIDLRATRNLSRLLDRSSDGLVILGADWHYRYVNQAAAAMLGRTPDSLIGRNIWAEFPEGREQPFHLAYQRAMAEQQAASFEDYFAPWDRWFENRLLPTGNGLAIFFHDVTERKRAESQAREQQQVLLESQDVAHVGSWSLDLSTGRMHWSPEAYRLGGVTPQSFEPSVESLLSLLDPADRPAASAWIQTRIEGKNAGERDYRVPLPNGRVRVVSVRGELRVDAMGRPLRVVGTVQDVTERRQVEEALRESEARFRTLSEAAFEGVAILERGVIIDASQRFADMFGYALEELIGMSAARLTAPESRTQVLEHIAEGFEEPYEAFGLRKDGTRIVGEVHARASRYHGRDVRITAFRDISDRKSAEDRLRQSLARLRRVAGGQERVREAERMRMAREVHDELGQLLTGIKMDLRWVSSRIPPERDEVRRRLEAMSALADEAVMAGRRIASDLRPGVLDDLGLAAAVRWQAREFGERTGITVHIEADDRIAVHDEPATALFRILQEALTNVARHAAASEVTISLHEEGGALVLRVRDDGRGITPAQAEGAASLGLLGMRERAEAWSGSFDMVRGAAGGTEVRVRIPLAGVVEGTSR